MQDNENIGRTNPTPFLVRTGEVLRGAVNDAARMAWAWYPAARPSSARRPASTPMTSADAAIRAEIGTMMDAATSLLESLARLEIYLRAAHLGEKVSADE